MVTRSIKVELKNDLQFNVIYSENYVLKTVNFCGKFAAKIKVIILLKLMTCNFLMCKLQYGFLIQEFNIKTHK